MSYGLGSERTITNTSGAVQATLTLTAFGQTLASSGSSTDPYQYAATSRYRTDGDAGLALVGCRYYDPQVGQFITRDTYLDQKPYAYCDGDPVNKVDPSGHISSDGWFGGGVGLICAGLAAIVVACSLPVDAVVVSAGAIWAIGYGCLFGGGVMVGKAKAMEKTEKKE